MSNSNKKKKQWKEEKDRLLKMTPEERSKRKLEKTPVSIKEIPSWMDEAKRKTAENDENPEQQRRSLSEKVSLYNGDITLLEVDAIVNAANSSLLGGGGVDGCIHRASGPYLLAECRTLGGCQTGQAKITCGFDLPAKYVIHTVGPIARGQINEHHNKALTGCYNSSLELAKENKIRSIAFPCISTGIYGFPNEPAANIALTTVKEWLKKNQDAMDRIIFCAFLEVDVKIYEKKMNEVFPTDDDDDDNKDEDNDEEEENVQDNKDTDKISDGQAIKETESDDKHNEKSDEEEQDSSPVTSEEGTVLPKENISVEKNEDTADEEMGSQAEESQGLIRDSSNDGDTQMESQDLLHSPEVNANVETITNKSEDDVKETTQEDKVSADPKALSDDEMNSQVESMMDSQDG